MSGRGKAEGGPDQSRISSVSPGVGAALCTKGICVKRTRGVPSRLRTERERQTDRPERDGQRDRQTETEGQTDRDRQRQTDRVPVIRSNNRHD